MATTGTFAFNPKFAEHIDEAFERCGIDPADLKARHIRSAKRSASLMLKDWQNFGLKQHAIELYSAPLVAGVNTIVLPVGGVDIFHATLKRDGRETEMTRLSRNDFNAIHDKSLQGRPDRYFVDRGTFIGDAPASTVYLWFVPENSTDTIEMYYLRTLEDAGDPLNTLDLPPSYQEAFSAGLAFMLSKKYAPERARALRDDYLGAGYDEFKNSMPGGALGRALAEDRDTGDAVMRVQFGRRRGRR